VLADQLVRSTAGFVREIARLPGVSYSTIAWRVLAEIETNGPARVSALAQIQRVAQPSMTALVHRLQADQWIEKSADPDDGRASLVSLTRAGAEALAEYRRACAARLSPKLAALSSEDRAVLERAATLLQQLNGRGATDDS